MHRGEQDLFLQYVAAICAFLGAAYIGTTIGFTSPVGPLLLEKNSTIVLTEGELDWFSSSLNIGAMVGSIVSGYFMSTFGRRGTMMMLSVPSIAGWILAAFSQNFTMLLIARLIMGFVGGVVPTVVLAYVGEISSPKIRGKLGSMYITLIGIGILYVYCIGALIKDLRWISLLCIPIPMLYVLAMYFLPESPLYLIGKGRNDQMEEALRRFNGRKYDISGEVSSLEELVRNESETKPTIREKINKLKSAPAYKPLLLIVFLYFFMHFGGIVAIIFNLNLIFQASGSNISADVSSIIFISLYTVGSVISAALVDRMGRRILILVSAIGMALTLGTLGVFFFVKNIDQEWNLWAVTNLGWLPLLCLCSYVLIFIVGVGTVPFVLVGEVFHPDVADISGSIATFMLWFATFVVTLTFNPIKSVIGDHGLYWFYAGCSLVCFFYAYYFVPETTGKTKEEIAQLYVKSKLIDSRDGEASV